LGGDRHCYWLLVPVVRGYFYWVVLGICAELRGSSVFLVIRCALLLLCENLNWSCICGGSAVDYAFELFAGPARLGQGDLFFLGTIASESYCILD